MSNTGSPRERHPGRRIPSAEWSIAPAAGRPQDREASAPTPRRRLDLRAVVLVLLLCVIWGLQQVVMKIVSGDAAPVMQLAIRFAVAAVFFSILVGIREGRSALADGTLPSGILLGVLFSLEFILISQALNHTTAAHTTVFLYSAPIFTALGLQFLPDERLAATQWVGIATAMLGLAVAFLGPGDRPVAELVKGDCLALLGGAMWGLSNVALRRGRIGTAATAKTVLYQVSTAAVLLSLFAILAGETRFVPTASVLLAMTFQTLMISIVSYLIWFWLLRKYMTSRLMLLTLLTPLFGVMFAASILGDRVELRFALGSLMVLAGILITNRQLISQR